MTPQDKFIERVRLGCSALLVDITHERQDYDRDIVMVGVKFGSLESNLAFSSREIRINGEKDWDRLIRSKLETLIAKAKERLDG